MMKDLEDNGGGNFGSVKKTTEQRIRNIARLYAWLVAKDRLALTILKVCEQFVFQTAVAILMTAL
jgi:hypothetical protein